MARKPRVVIAGAGFAAVKTAKALKGKAKITLIAPTDRFVYLPLIHELVSERETPPSVSKKLADIFQTAKLVEGRVVAVEDDEAVTEDGHRFPFDAFVCAIGAEPNDFGLHGVREHTFSFYSVRDALLANGMLKAKAAEVYGRPVHVAIVGASFTGIEVAGEVRELFAKLDVPCDIDLVEAGDALFPRQSKEFQKAVKQACKEMDLRVLFEHRIASVGPEAVVAHTPKGEVTLSADVVLWCAGAKPRSIEGVDPHVRPTLQSKERDDVFVVGDAATFPREMGVPKLAQTAELQGPVAAHNILNPDRMKEYVPEVKGLIITVGKDRAVAEIGDTVLSGKIPWHVKKRLYKAKIALT